MSMSRVLVVCLFLLAVVVAKDDDKTGASAGGAGKTPKTGGAEAPVVPDAKKDVAAADKPKTMEERIAEGNAPGSAIAGVNKGKAEAALLLKPACKKALDTKVANLKSQIAQVVKDIAARKETKDEKTAQCKREKERKDLDPKPRAQREHDCGLGLTKLEKQEASRALENREKALQNALQLAQDEVQRAEHPDKPAAKKQETPDQAALTRFQSAKTQAENLKTIFDDMETKCGTAYPNCKPRADFIKAEYKACTDAPEKVTLAGQPAPNIFPKMPDNSAYFCCLRYEKSEAKAKTETKTADQESCSTFVTQEKPKYLASCPRVEEYESALETSIAAQKSACNAENIDCTLTGMCRTDQAICTMCNAEKGNTFANKMQEMQVILDKVKGSIRTGTPLLPEKDANNVPVRSKNKRYYNSKTADYNSEEAAPAEEAKPAAPVAPVAPPATLDVTLKGGEKAGLPLKGATLPAAPAAGAAPVAGAAPANAVAGGVVAPPGDDADVQTPKENTKPEAGPAAAAATQRRLI